MLKIPYEVKNLKTFGGQKISFSNLYIMSDVSTKQSWKNYIGK